MDKLVEDVARAIADVTDFDGDRMASRYADSELRDVAKAAIRVIAPAILEQAANVAPAKIRAETCETVGQWERRALREAIRALKEGYSHDQ